MKKLYLFALFIIGLPKLAYADNDTVKTDKHHHHNAEQIALTLDDGQKWPIDQSLHQGMSNIKTLIASDLEDIHYKKQTATGYRKLAKGIDSHIQFIFKHCNLPEKADAQLHILLAKIMQGNDQMKNNHDARQGAVKIIAALADYHHYFDDKNWQALKH